MPKLTHVQLSKLTEQDANKRLFDGDGLYGRVRHQKSGIVVTFEYRYKLGGKSKSFSCGKWPASTLKEIRRQRDEKQALVASGVDPVEQRASERLTKQIETATEVKRKRESLANLAAEEAARRTLRAAIEQWHQLELSRRKDQGKEAMRAIEKDVLSTLGELSLPEITRAMLIDVFDKIVSRGAVVMANQLFGDLKQFFNFAYRREWIAKSPLDGLTKDNIGGRPQERDRHLSEDEIIELATALPNAKLQHTTELAIWIMLSTCCRVGEISRARWADIDLDRREWVIPAGNSKNAKSLTIWLSDFALDKFNRLREITGATAWCLPSRDGQRHICVKSIAKQIKDRVRDEPLANRSTATGTLLLSGGAWTPHDLRRTAATLMGEAGVLSEVIERCLNHVETNRLKRIYQRQELKKEKEAAWRLLGDRLEKLTVSQLVIKPQLSALEAHNTIN